MRRSTVRSRLKATTHPTQPHYGHRPTGPPPTKHRLSRSIFPATASSSPRAWATPSSASRHPSACCSTNSGSASSARGPRGSAPASTGTTSVAALMPARPTAAARGLNLEPPRRISPQPGLPQLACPLAVVVSADRARCQAAGSLSGTAESEQSWRVDTTFPLANEGSHRRATRPTTAFGPISAVPHPRRGTAHLVREMSPSGVSDLGGAGIRPTKGAPPRRWRGGPWPGRGMSPRRFASSRHENAKAHAGFLPGAGSGRRLCPSRCPCWSSSFVCDEARIRWGRAADLAPPKSLQA
jgi:hypothetical protein